MDINNLYISQNDPKLFKGFVSASTRGKSGDMEVVFTVYISFTGKTIIAELKVYQGYKIIAKCDIRKQVTSYLNHTVREAAEILVEISGFSKVNHGVIHAIDYKQARAFVQQLLEQLTNVKPDLTSIETTPNWRLL